MMSIVAVLDFAVMIAVVVAVNTPIALGKDQHGRCQRERQHNCNT
jgi:hypothetical protein